MIYSVEGAGGYQLFGRSPVPVLDDTLYAAKDFQDSMKYSPNPATSGTTGV